MELERQALAGAAQELRGVVDVLRDLTDEEWETPTRCPQWRLVDIAQHLAEVVTGTLSSVFYRSGSDVGVVAPDSRRSRGGLTQEVASIADVLDEVARRMDDRPGAAAFGPAIEELWFEIYVHGDDIRDALGRASHRGAGVRNAVVYLSHLLSARGWEATLALDGLEPILVGGTGGPAISGDPLTFVLVATGRAHPIELGLHKGQVLNVFA